MQKIRVAIVGPTGYTAYEAIRILLRHPHAAITVLASRREPQPHIAEIFPALRGMLDLRCEPIDADAIARKADVALMCLPHKVAMQSVPCFLAAGMKVVDLSADYRLKSPADYQRWYEHEHVDQKNLAGAAFGLPEFYRRQIRTAQLVANPGCYPTASILGIAPFVTRKLVEPADLIVSAASGVSGAGKEAKPEHPLPRAERDVRGLRRRHAPAHDRDPTNAGGPGGRGTQPDLRAAPGADAPRHPGNHLPEAPAGDDRRAGPGDPGGNVQGRAVRPVSKDLPSTKNVAQTNFCDLSVRLAAGRLVVLSAIDNLIKGASGQAIQNMNLQFGLPESAGLLC